MNNAFYVLIIAIMLYIYIYLEKPEKGYSLLVERSLDYGPKSLVYEVFLLGANESHTFTRYVVSIQSYDPETKTSFEGEIDEIGTLLPFDESSKYGDLINTIVESREQFTPEAKILWFPPIYFECVLFQAKVFHPSTGWIEDEKALKQIICSASEESKTNDETADLWFDRENDEHYKDTIHSDYNAGIVSDDRIVQSEL